MNDRLPGISVSSPVVQILEALARIRIPRLYFQCALVDGSGILKALKCSTDVSGGHQSLYIFRMSLQDFDIHIHSFFDAVEFHKIKVSQIFPKSDVLILPIKNTTVEEFARLLSGKLKPLFKQHKNIDAIEVGVFEYKGQGCYKRITR